MSTPLEVTCPSCSFSRSVPLESSPQKTVLATCPKCGASFPFNPLEKASHFEAEKAGHPDMNVPVEATKDADGADLELQGSSEFVANLQLVGSQEKKTGSLSLFIVTIMIFFSAQIVSMKWQELLILVGVLLFHELGHMTAMKLLKYSDLKMFFIPFIGAAVSGKNSNPTALKSCIVSLMGPLPGIVLSVILYVIFLLTKNYYVYKTAQVMMLLNVFNLLPIMPLDGGRFVDVLFVNRRYFRFVFSFLGAGAFLIMAKSSEDFLLGFVGVLTIYLALGNLKLHGISSDLKSEGLMATSVDDLIRDEESLQHVVGKIRAVFPKLFDPNVDYKGIHSKLTVVVDTMKFKPAKFLPKTLLLTGYIVCTLASVIGMILLVGTNYREVLRTDELNGKKVAYVERHFYGKKRSECPINSQLYYDGEGTAFDDDGSVGGTYYYKDGYRTGEWVDFKKSGEVEEKRIYNRGRLTSISTLKDSTWKTATVETLPVLERWSEEVQRVSQPVRSNHVYF